MGKIVLWLVIIFAALFALRLLNSAKNRSRNRADQGRETGAKAQPMVRCSECGVFLPRADSQVDGDKFRCTDAKCQNRQRA